MPELRWTLLIIGVLFIAVLAWWERRRPHQASRQAPHISGEPRPLVSNDPSWAPEVEPVGGRPATPHIGREPTLTLPEIRTEARAEARMELRAREPIAPRELPIVEIPDSAGDSEEEISEELEEISAEISKDASKEGVAEISKAVEEEAEELDDEERVERANEGKRPVPKLAANELEDYEDEESEGDGASRDEDVDEEERGANVRDEPVARGELDDEVEGVGKAVDVKAVELPPPVVNTTRPFVEWPPDDQRKVVALRLVARPPDRFRGTLVRQALAAEGFILGDFDIFHKPDAQNRAVLSAASLTKPGTFDLDTMDTQRYTGLNLFAVLPGPKPPRKAFEDLLMAARMLNERLEGALQDERGGPLTPMRIQAIRDALETEAKS